MNSFTFNKTKLNRFIIISSAAFCLSFAFAVGALSAQTKGKKSAAKQPVNKKAATPTSATALPKVNQIDEVALLNLLKRNGENSKPLLVNFWATWCGPCVEEFPDLVKISNDYQGKIDVITVTLDDLAEINTSVPQFLAKMKATMPTYLLKTTDENAAIESISKDWQGGLPFTILYDGKGATVYSKQAKFVPAALRGEIDKLINKGAVSVISDQKALDISTLGKPDYSYKSGVTAANNDIATGRLKVLFYGLRPVAADESNRHTTLKGKYRIEIEDSGCIIPSGFKEFAKGYNETSTSEIQRKFGVEPLKLLGIL